jgi:hypothetical protein
MWFFFHVGWMEFYDGLDAGDNIQGGGAFVKNNDFGSEVYNYQKVKIWSTDMLNLVAELT